MNAIKEQNSTNYQKEKAEKALEKAKALETERIKKGYKWKNIPGTTTEVLRKDDSHRI